MPDPSFVFPLLLQSVLIPALAAFAMLLVPAGGKRAAGVPLAIAAGFLASYIATYHAQWSFPPHAALDWVPLLLALSLAYAAAMARPQGRTMAGAALALAICAMVAWPALGSAGLPKTLATIAVTATLMIAATRALESVAGAAPLSLTLAAGGAGLALLIDASQLLGQLCGALGIATAACGLAGRRAGGFGTGGIAVAACLLLALLAYAHVYAGFGLGMALLPAAGLFSGALPALLRRQPAHRLTRWVASGLLTAVPVAVVLGLAIRAMQESGGY